MAHDDARDEMMLAVNYFVVGKVQIFAHSSSGQFTYRSSSTSINDGNWHFVVGMLDGGVGTANLRIFVDGFEETMGTANFYGTVQPLSDSTPRFFTIGDRSTTNPGFSTPFNGSIDDVRLYNRVLSAGEVTALWNGTGGGGSSGGGGSAGSNWTLASNGETRYLYDGRRVIQERDGNNTPTVSYTRGLDLSGSLGGAGGIGGLLARSHGYSGGSWTAHNFYHSDGNGNITALIDNTTSPAIQASYTYDPFGRTITQSGSLADANVYRFSSKQFHSGSDPGSGLYYYGFRFYEPNLQRWLNRDQIGEFSDGPNLYGYVRNNPANAVDPSGLESFLMPPQYAQSSEFRAGFQQGACDAAVGAGSVLLGVFVEPYDWIMTGIEIFKDPMNPLSYAGAIPFVPSAAGKAAKRLKIGNFLKGADVAEAGAHAAEVGNVTGVVDRAGAAERRAERLKGQPKVPGKDLDEFPPASIKPDDPSKVSVKPIDRSQNRRSGGRLGHELPPDGTPVQVVPPKCNK